MTCGIYSIVHRDSGKTYVGSALNIERRWGRHRTDLNRKKHFNPILTNAWHAHGAGAFDFRVLLVCRESDLLMYEQRCIDGLGAHLEAGGFNICPASGNRRGTKMNENQRRALAKAHQKMRGENHPMFGRKRPDASEAMKKMNSDPDIAARRRDAIIAANKRRAGTKRKGV